MLNVGGPELLIILLVALVFLGPQRLPELARQMGQAVSSLRSLASGFQAELEAAARPDPDTSMKLEGPTKQSDAIAQTQSDAMAKAHSDPKQGDATQKPEGDATEKPKSDKEQRHVATGDALGGETKGTDPASVAKAARDVTYGDDEPAVSSGGPTDLVVTAKAGRDVVDGAKRVAATDTVSDAANNADSTNATAAADETPEKPGAGE